MGLKIKSAKKAAVVVIMINKVFSGISKRLLIFFCFIACLRAFIFVAPNKAYATELDGLGLPSTDSLVSSSPTVVSEPGSAQTPDDLRDLNVSNGLSITYRDENGNLSGALRILITLTLVALLPTILMMMTSFTRILIVFHFLRTALGTQTAPPNQVLVGLSLFLTLFIMNPVLTTVNEQALKPFEAGEMTQDEFLKTAIEPFREYMYGQTLKKDVRLFLDIEGTETVESLDEIPTRVLVPAFMMSELRAAFIIGFLLYIPFIVIDMVVASTLMAMGMMMLPPTTISTPFKILLFVLADGWSLVIGNLVKTFY